MDTRTPFVRIWQKYRFNVSALAKSAKVPVIVILFMMRGTPVKRESATKVLRVLSDFYKQKYTFQSVRVKLKEDHG